MDNPTLTDDQSDHTFASQAREAETANRLNPSACQICGAEPAIRVTVRRHVGMLFMQRFVKIRAMLCRDCGRQMLRSFTARTLVQGWWGVISFLIANPFTILANIEQYVRVSRLPAPVRDAAAYDE